MRNLRVPQRATLEEVEEEEMALVEEVVVRQGA